MRNYLKKIKNSKSKTNLSKFLSFNSYLDNDEISFEGDILIELYNDDIIIDAYCKYYDLDDTDVIEIYE